MVSPELYREAFLDTELVTFERAVLEKLGLSEADTRWLATVGLPDSAAPFLDFGGREMLRVVSDLWRGVRGAEKAGRACVIGSNGSGDPVAIDPDAGGAVVYFNHDNDMERVFINSSVRQLAACLVAFKKMVAAAREVNGSDAYLDGDVPAGVIDEFVERVRAVDLFALGPGMWMDEVASLRRG